MLDSSSTNKIRNNHPRVWEEFTLDIKFIVGKKIRNNHPRVWKEFKIDVRFTVDEQNKK